MRCTGRILSISCSATGASRCRQSPIPASEGSGLTNESKDDLFNLLGPVGRAHLAPFVTIRTEPAIRLVDEARRAMERAGLSFRSWSNRT